jgi:hypothetical protein
MATKTVGGDGRRTPMSTTSPASRTASSNGPHCGLHRICPRRNRSPIFRKACNSPSFKRSRGIGAIDDNWRRCEAQLNAHPQFITEIDGLDIHFMHVRSKHEDAMPLIVTHGWPGSPIEQLKIIDPLTNPTAHGASASDAFHVVIP